MVNYLGAWSDCEAWVLGILGGFADIECYVFTTGTCWDEGFNRKYGGACGKAVVYYYGDDEEGE